MNIGEAQVATVLGVNVFDQVFKALYNAGTIPRRSSSDVTVSGVTLNATVLLNQPSYALTTADPPRLRLGLTGNVELRPQGETEGTPLTILPLDTGVGIDFVAQPRAGEPPMVGLQYMGVIDPPAPPITPAMIDAAFTQPPLSTFLAALALDLFTPMVDALEERLFPEDDDEPPPRDTWATAIRLLPARDGTVDAVAFQIARPGEAADGGEATSHLPALTELGVVYSRRLMDALLAAAAAEQVGTEASGATITRLALSMGDDAILIDGHASKENAEIDFEGPVRIALIRGTTAFAGDASGVDVDVDVPWWVDLLRFFTSPLGGFLSFGLLTLTGEAIFALGGTSSSEVEAEIGAAPNLVRGSLITTLTDSLAALAEALEVETAPGGAAAQSTPDRSVTEDGHIAVYAQIFVLPVIATIVDAVYSKTLRRFRDYQIEGGRWFRSTELTRLVETGIITTPRYHAVSRIRDGQETGWMRADPDESLSNNLEELFE